MHNSSTSNHRTLFTVATSRQNVLFRQQWIVKHVNMTSTTDNHVHANLLALIKQALANRALIGGALALPKAQNNVTTPM